MPIHPFFAPRNSAVPKDQGEPSPGPLKRQNLLDGEPWLSLHESCQYLQTKEKLVDLLHPGHDLTSWSGSLFIGHYA